MTALIRNLATMTRVGVLAPGSDGTAKVGRAARRRASASARRASTRSRCWRRCAPTRPAAACAAGTVDAGARRSSTRSTPRSTRRSSNVEPTGKRLLLALDVSGSMAGGCVAGVPGLTPRDASAALALVTAATETRYEIVGFFAGKGGWKARHAAGSGPRRTA